MPNALHFFRGETNLKKIFLTLIFFTMLLFALLTTASASNYDHCADELKELGLFQGTDTGYDLDKPVTRVQAVTMLVRLLGKEDEAKTNSALYNVPFSDVPEWASSYVGYAAQHGLVNGITETTFAPDVNCTAQMFATLLLRAMGYDDINSDDFSYNNALQFAAEKNILDGYIQSDNSFLRDNMVALSYNALARDTKDGDMLLQKLIDEGAVDADIALENIATFSAYRNIESALNKVNSLSALETLTVNTFSGNTDGTVVLTAEQDIIKKYVSSPSELYYISIADSYTHGDTTETSTENSYYSENKVYVENSLGKFIYNYDSSTLQIGLTVDPLCTIDSINTKIVSGGNTMYTIYYESKSLPVGSEFVDELGNVTVTSLECSIVLDANLELVNYNIFLHATVVSDSTTYDVLMDSSTTITATGSTVELELPEDLNEYKQVVG